MKNEAYNSERPGRRISLLRKYFPAHFLALTIAYCAFIFYLSSISSLPVPPPFIFFDKIVHFGLYGGLGAIVVLGVQRAGREYSAGMQIVVPAVFCFFYGLSDEIHQVFVAHRTFDLGDLAADVAGAVAAAALLLYLRRWTKSKA